MDEQILEETGAYQYRYPIYDQTNKLITDPDLDKGYLKEEHQLIHHETIPECWTYRVSRFDFTNGEFYEPESNDDPHVKVIDAENGLFEWVNIEGEPERVVFGQSNVPDIHQEMVPAWEEERTIYRYVLYTQKELANKAFLDQGPRLLVEAWNTINDLTLALADLMGNEEPAE